MEPYKVLVVDDSAFMRKIISDLIENDANFQVTATASNGREAIDKIKEISPDLVTMDVEMPEMNGLEALKIIMVSNPLPVIMLSGINEEGMKETILALEWGAFDFIRKPSISNSQDIIGVGESLREQMKEAMLARKQREARISANTATKFEPLSAVSLSVPDLPKVQPEKVVIKQNEADVKSKPNLAGQKLPPARTSSLDTKAEGKLSSYSAPLDKGIPKNNMKPAALPPKPAIEKLRDRTKVEKKPSSTLPQEISVSKAVPDTPKVGGDRKIVGKDVLNKLVAVGCSTGGPRALKALLENIPANFPAPIVIVQHMPPNFTKSLAQRLNTFSPLEVTEAEHGMILRQGSVYIAPGGYHMKISSSVGGQYMVSLNKEESRNGHRPSVDTLFESLLPLTSLERHAVLMTGMGSDGAKMMKSLYDSGVTSTFAESEETCVVYGMPRSAVELQCVRHILPLQEIAPRLVQIVK
ncbi:protein-glutamate methylesterase/protein-glutamine glutaminase [Paenibacillus wynnii]|uniref:protein-glutamate methylesterase/protein-glutamine glutaminase n=1 Tax=Paenibacillus wynnii TaxID=268407 RepID=UPI00278E0DFD|nr:chemotaxis response regulator protein-glutamate methylesterase [Paenibacillus wynnii]MDQ0193471.1 two-component system chemotaxis response regulator CheB [Paenibacillus wynnii]